MINVVGWRFVISGSLTVNITITYYMSELRVIGSEINEEVRCSSMVRRGFPHICIMYMYAFVIEGGGREWILN
ncbi:MAG: hypothetical protein ACTS4Y_00720 [Candidatus Hodgkinia cicadicola]